MRKKIYQLEEYVREVLEREAEEMNREAESQYCEGLTQRQRRDYYAIHA